jgi:hypothetical protein
MTQFLMKNDGAKMGVGGKPGERFPMNCRMGGMNCQNSFGSKAPDFTVSILLLKFILK